MVSFNRNHFEVYVKSHHCFELSLTQVTESVTQSNQVVNGRNVIRIIIVGFLFYSLQALAYPETPLFLDSQPVYSWDHREEARHRVEVLRSSNACRVSVRLTSVHINPAAETIFKAAVSGRSQHSDGNVKPRQLRGAARIKEVALATGTACERRSQLIRQFGEYSSRVMSADVPRPGRKYEWPIAEAVTCLKSCACCIAQ